MTKKNVSRAAKAITIGNIINIFVGVAYINMAAAPIPRIVSRILPFLSLNIHSPVQPPRFFSSQNNESEKAIEAYKQYKQSGKPFPQTIFSKIINKEIPAKIVHEDDLVSSNLYTRNPLMITALCSV